jgi:polyphosphate kinase
MLVVRREAAAPHGLRSYVHVGTGNYNPSTARVYTDFGLLTCDPEICSDVVDLFKFLTGVPAAPCIRLCSGPHEALSE